MQIHDSILLPLCFFVKNAIMLDCYGRTIWRIISASWTYLKYVRKSPVYPSRTIAYCWNGLFWNSGIVPVSTVSLSVKTAIHGILVSARIFNVSFKDWFFNITNSVAPEPEVSSSHWQELVSGPYPEQVNPLHTPQPISRSILIPSSHLCLGLTSGPFCLNLSHKTL
jgi:hypothetical protein